MLDRLVGRAVLAQADGIMRHHIDRPRILKRGQAYRGAAIVRKHEEGAAIGNDAAVQRHAVHRGCRAELADAVIDIAAGIVLRSVEHTSETPSLIRTQYAVSSVK